MACRNLRIIQLSNPIKLLNTVRTCVVHKGYRAHSQCQVKSPEFGLLFDIDGVIVRGKKVLPEAVECFQKLIDSSGQFRVPTVFVTNAGNALRHEKAEQLSNWLGVEVSEDQVVMAHSPLRMFQEFHSKRLLISGQGPIKEIAKHLGFNRVVTIEEMRYTFPMLDCVDHKRRKAVPCTFQEYFPRIEGIVLFGEPIRWETALQLLVDTLMTNGTPAFPPPEYNYPHIPVLACNMDLQWMAEAWIPRFGHGCFLLCLENLYKKITGRNLIYKALIGKPSEVTFHHAHHMVVSQAERLGLATSIKRLYAVGDNIYTDVFGANLYDRYLQWRRSNSGGAPTARGIEELLGNEAPKWEREAESCSSILVLTGVYSEHLYNSHKVDLDHSPRDFLPVEEKLRSPKYTVANVLSAVDLVFAKENFE